MLINVVTGSSYKVNTQKEFLLKNALNICLVFNIFQKILKMKFDFIFEKFLLNEQNLYS
jgi:hypothetical protein